MRMRVDEARKDDAISEVELLRVARSLCRDVRLAADRNYSIALGQQRAAANQTEALERDAALLRARIARDDFARAND